MVRLRQFLIRLLVILALASVALSYARHKPAPAVHHPVHHSKRIIVHGS